MSTTHRHVRGTGDGFVAQPGERGDMPVYDPVTSEHLWTVSLSYRILDPARVRRGVDGPALLDQENLLAVTPVICWHCERAWTPALGADPCEGDPA